MFLVKLLLGFISRENNGVIALGMLYSEEISCLVSIILANSVCGLSSEVYVKVATDMCKLKKTSLCFLYD